MALLLRLLCLVAALGAYLCSSGLLRLNEVFFQSSLGASTSLDDQNPLGSDTELSEAAYDRLVVVLIDALRADMVLGSAAMHGNEDATDQKEELNTHMPFTSSLVSSGRALGYVAHASVPTVTMPRLKALVTGKAPAFIDILKNFNSAALADDSNLVALLAASGKRIVFYGDDTWLKLFPETFKRSDGTSGFYTRDTVEVDTNVTRHLSEELDPTMQHEKSSDWDALVLHYLGLDHVGHLRGPRSSLMREKLVEMDGVVKLVVDSVREQDERRMKDNGSAKPSLILLCSDHGMSEVGNHGGATLEESSALLMFLRGDGAMMRSTSDISYRQKRSQVDLVPTISALFGLPIPLYSTGLLLDDVVRSSSSSTRDKQLYYLRGLQRNFQQLYTLATIKFHASALAGFDAQYREPRRQLRDILDGKEAGASLEQLADLMLEACETLQDMVAQSDGSEYDGRAIFAGLVLLFTSSAMVMAMFLKRKHYRNAVNQRGSCILVVLSIGSILQIASLSSSSSIENEHATAFFFLTTMLVALGIHILRQKSSSTTNGGVISVGILLVLTRMLRARNQIINFWRLNGLHVDSTLSGNEFATDDSVSIYSTAAVIPPCIMPTSVCVAAISVIVMWKTVQRYRAVVQTKKQLNLAVTAASCVLFAVAMAASLRVKELDRPTTQGEGQRPLTQWIVLDADACARVVYGSVFMLWLLAIVAGKAMRLALVEMAIWLLVALLQRESNFATLCLLCLQMVAVSKFFACTEAATLRSSGAIIAGLSMWLSQAAFFALGNSHLVTTIDISQSYHGLSSYSQEVVGALTFVSVFSGPLICFVNLFQWLEVRRETSSSLQASSSSQAASSVLFVYQTLRFAVYTVVVYFMRFHLFIWSVFAPKMLYEVAHLAVSLVIVAMLAAPANTQLHTL